MLCMSRLSFTPHPIAVCGWRVDQLLVAVVGSGWVVRVDEAICSTLILRVGVERVGTSGARPRVVRLPDRTGEV
jgi:hypothetical protein